MDNLFRNISFTPVSVTHGKLAIIMIDVLNQDEELVFSFDHDVLDVSIANAQLRDLPSGETSFETEV